MSQKSIFSNVDRLAARAKSRQSTNDGWSALAAIMILSGVLSAIFFLKNSQAVFADIWPPLALILGLAVGLMPAEGAFFGWRQIRRNKRDMTQKQLAISSAGIWTSVTAAVFSTFALFVASFEYVPAEIRAYDTWLVFIALSVPIMVQIILISQYTVNERDVVENQGLAQLTAMAFEGYLHTEMARQESVLEGMYQELDKQLPDYGARRGREEASRLLADELEEELDRRAARPTSSPFHLNGQNHFS